MQKDINESRCCKVWGPHEKSLRVRKCILENLTQYIVISAWHANGFIVDAYEIISCTPSADEVSQGESGTIDSESFEIGFKKS